MKNYILALNVKLFLFFEIKYVLFDEFCPFYIQV